MTRRLAKKVAGHSFAYPASFFYRAFARLGAARWPATVSRAARRADRVLARRFEDDASRWLPGDGPPPSLYGTPKQGPPPRRATAP